VSLRAFSLTTSHFPRPAPFPLQNVKEQARERHTGSILPRFYGITSINWKIFSAGPRLSRRTSIFPMDLSSAEAQRGKPQPKR
jgi:hypothetical protein